MATKKVNDCEEAVKILRELSKTPQLVELWFEFTMGTNGLPYVEYRVKRFAVSEDTEKE